MTSADTDGHETESDSVARRLREAQRIAKIGSWELDIASGRLEWSEEIHRIFEIDPGHFDATYDALLAIVHPNDREAVDEAYRESLRTRVPYDMVHRLRMPDGRIKWVHERCETDFAPDGEPLISRGTVQDITDVKTTHDALRESRAVIETFLNASPEAVIVTDSRARITTFSVGAERIFGYAAAEVIGRPIEMLMPESMREAHRHHVGRFASSGETGRFMNERSEIVGQRKNGEVFPAEASLSKLETPSGMYFAAVLRDITEQKRIREDLVKAKMEADAASEAKSRFIANMSHELRTPLNAIIGFSDILRSELERVKAHSEYCEYVDHIHQSGQHLFSLVNDILEISRLDLGATNVTDEWLPVDVILEPSIAMIRVRAAEAGVFITVQVQEGLPDVRVDRRLFIQATLNLLSNAIKFTGTGGRVVVGAETTDAGGIDLFVSDTGIGMAPEDVARVGELFMQADTAMARRYEGTGLGLAIVKRLAQLHDAELDISSAPGAGTTARIKIPPDRVRGGMPERRSG